MDNQLSACPAAAPEEAEVLAPLLEAPELEEAVEEECEVWLPLADEELVAEAAPDEAVAPWL